MPDRGTIFFTDKGSVAEEAFRAYQGLKAVYQMKGYIVHRGQLLDADHYTAHIRKEKYYRCDDTLTQGYEEISENEFLGNTRPYVILLEKVAEGS